MAKQLRVYVRHGCHLCDDMLRALQALRPQQDFELNVIDISGDAQLEARYGTRVPVLLGGEEELCYYFLDEDALRAYFRQA